MPRNVFKPGQSGNPAGRKPGKPNKATTEFRETVTKLLDGCKDDIPVWLGRVAAEDPGRALELAAKLAEFAAPKLGRMEHVGDGGGAVNITINKVARHGD
jgi:hypothetical protein